MKIDRHIFGSYSGYSTVARSGGVSAEDARTLESGAYAFGQSHERSYFKSLQKQPAYFTRLLGGGRRGLTRVLEGNPDDNNRPTLRLITVVVSQRDWDTLICGDVNLLLENRALWDWDGSPNLPQLDVLPSPPNTALPRKSVDKILALLSAVEKAVAARRLVLVSADDYSGAEIRALEMLVPPPARRSFTSACRSLSAQLPATANLLAAEASAQGRGVYRYSAGAEALSPYAAHLSSSALMTGVIPLDVVAAYRSFGAAEHAAAGAPDAGVAPRIAAATAQREPHGSLLWLAAIPFVLLLCAGTFWAGKATGSSATLLAEQAREQAQRQQVEAQSNEALASQAAADRAKVKKALDVAGESMDDLLTAAGSKMQDLHNAATTSAHDTAEERDRYRSAYEGELKRQREQFEALSRDAAESATIKDMRKSSEAAEKLVKIQGQLLALSTNWPASSDKDLKWVDDLKTLRERVATAATVASSLARISVLLDDCESALRSSDAPALDSVKANLEEAVDLANNLPAKPDMGDFNVGGLRDAALARATKLRDWLTAQQKSNPSVAASPGATPPAPTAAWWYGLSAEEQERARKWYQDAIKRQEERRKQNDAKNAKPPDQSRHSDDANAPPPPADNPHSSNTRPPP